MAIKIIKYLPKHTGAKTNYREISEEDQQWLNLQMIRWLSAMAELDQQRDEDSRWVRDQWWHKRTDKLHRGQNGQNTPCSVVGGILNNMMFKDTLQRDFSDKQMADIEYISAILAQVIEDCEAVRFQVGLE